MWSQKVKELLERVQHRFTRMIEGFSSLPYAERLSRLCLWTSEEKRNRCDLIEVFKMFYGYTDVRYPKPPNSINSTILFTYFIVTHRNAR